MDIAIQTTADYHLVRFQGELRAADGAAIERDVHPLIGPGEAPLILDLSALASVDSGGLSQLISLTTHARLSESRVIMVKPTPFVAGVLEVTRLDTWFEVADDIAAAEVLLRAW